MPSTEAQIFERLLNIERELLGIRQDVANIYDALAVLVKDLEERSQVEHRRRRTDDPGPRDARHTLRRGRRGTS